MKKKFYIVLIFICFLVLSACTVVQNKPVDQSTVNNEFEYIESPYDACDYSTKNLCNESGCKWRLMTDAIEKGVPTPATCCPADIIPISPNPDGDPCKQIHG